MVAIGEIVNSSDVESRCLQATYLVGRLMEQFDAEHKFVGDLAPQHPAREPMILVTGSGIDPVAAAAESCPVAEVLLNPDRHESMSPAGAEPAIDIACRRLQQRVDGD